MSSRTTLQEHSQVPFTRTTFLTSWNARGTLVDRIYLGICTNPASQQCGCDSLSISDVFNARQLCLGTEIIPFISLENRISLTMVTDEQYSSKGFIAKYESVFLHGGWLSVNVIDVVFRGQNELRRARCLIRHAL